MNTSVPNLEVKHEGNQIILPLINGKPMTYDEGCEWMKRKKLEEEQQVTVHHEIPCSPLDGAVAFQRALAEIYGWVEMVPTPSFFGSNPPKMIGINISATDIMQVPLGRVEIPGIVGFLQTGMVGYPRPAFIIDGQVRKKHEEQVKDIVQLTKKLLKEKSIYKGKAVKINLEWMGDHDEPFDPIEHSPKFMELSGISDDDLIFGETVLHALDIGLFTPIEHSSACRECGIPLKRGVLLEGPYGTGKTLTAYVTALKAVRNGWTFVYLDSVRDLKKGLEFAAQYAPCVLFAEDIDRVLTGNRSLSMDDMLNTLDGVDTKGAEIITVFTTNHIENINPAVLRMGRLDTLVHVSPPDAKAAERLVRLYARGLLEEGADLEKIGNVLAGQIPAFIREVTERAKLATISRSGTGDIKGKVLEQDLLAAAKAMESHAELLKPKTDNVIDMSQALVPVSAAKAAMRNGNGAAA